MLGAYNQPVFGIGGSELVVIVLVALLVFGPSRIPEIARTIKRVVQELARIRHQVDETVTEIRRELDLRLDEDDRPSAPAPLVLPPTGENAAPDGLAPQPATRAPALPVAAEDDYLAQSSPAGGTPEDGAGHE